MRVIISRPAWPPRNSFTASSLIILGIETNYFETETNSAIRLSPSLSARVFPVSFKDVVVIRHPKNDWIPQ